MSRMRKPDVTREATNSQIIRFDISELCARPRPIHRGQPISRLVHGKSMSLRLVRWSLLYCYTDTFRTIMLRSLANTSYDESGNFLADDWAVMHLNMTCTEHSRWWPFAPVPWSDNRSTSQNVSATDYHASRSIAQLWCVQLDLSRFICYYCWKTQRTILSSSLG